MPGEGVPEKEVPGKRGTGERDAVPGKRVVLGHIGPLTWGSGRSRRGLRGSAAPPQEARCLQAPWRSKRPPRAQRFSGTQAPGAAARRTPSSASSAAASSASSANIAQRSAAQRGARSAERSCSCSRFAAGPIAPAVAKLRLEAAYGFVRAAGALRSRIEVAFVY